MKKICVATLLIAVSCLANSANMDSPFCKRINTTYDKLIKNEKEPKIKVELKKRKATYIKMINNDFTKPSDASNRCKVDYDLARLGINDPGLRNRIINDNNSSKLPSTDAPVDIEALFGKPKN